MNNNKTSGQITPARFRALTKRYRQLRIAVAGDFCLDRYLEIDPARKEFSLETGLPVHNVVRIRSQPGGAGTIVNNLAALGVAEIFPVGFAGDDGDGFDLRRALTSLPGVRAQAFFLTPQRRTFTYTKPLLVSPAPLSAGVEPIGHQELESDPGQPATPPDQRPAPPGAQSRCPHRPGPSRCTGNRRHHPAGPASDPARSKSNGRTCSSWPTAGAACKAILLSA